MASPAPDTKPATVVPNPEPSDSSKVASCLETAQELWTNGQMREAVRWIQRGAEAAEEDGNDMRALSLARLGAELNAQMKGSSPSLPKAPEPPRPPGAEKNADKGADASPPSHSPSPPRARVSHPPPLPGAASASTAPSASSASVAPSPPNASASAEKVEKADRAEKVDKTEKAEKSSDVAPVSQAAPESSPRPSTKSAAPDKPSVKPTASRTPGPLSTAPAKPVPSSPPAMSASAAIAADDVPSAKGKASTPLSELISSGLAQRVSVKRSAVDAGLLVVRPASGNGAKNIAGARQAVLIYLDGDSDT